MLGIDDRLGSLEEGKEATLFICEGDALDMRGNQVTHAFINGREINLDNKQEASKPQIPDEIFQNEVIRSVANFRF